MDTVWSFQSLARSALCTIALLGVLQVRGTPQLPPAQVGGPLKVVYPPTPPGPLEFDGVKLVHDAAHPWKPLRKGDIRGPCPALNTLASHGYLPRDGVATPSQIVAAAMEGFNQDNSVSIFATYQAMLVGGNLLTDKLSIGRKTSRTGPYPPPPATAGGLNQPNIGVEGDASLFRSDSFLGDNHNFNQTLFNEFKDFSRRYGGGFYNLTVAGEHRYHRIQQSIATNPKFSLVMPRYVTAYSEATFPVTAFVDGRLTSPEDRKLSMGNALSFFRDHRFPKDWHRVGAPFSNQGVSTVFDAHPVERGRNQGRVNTYTPDLSTPAMDDVCGTYAGILEDVKRLYPRGTVTGMLRRNLVLNLEYLWSGLPSLVGCQQLFPYGNL